MTPSADLYTKHITDLKPTGNRANSARPAQAGVHIMLNRVHGNTLDGLMQAELKEDDDYLKRNVEGYCRRPMMHSA